MGFFREVEYGLVENVFRDNGAVEHDGVVDKEAVFAIGLNEDGEPAGLGRSVIASPFAAVGSADVGVGVLVRSEGVELLLLGFAACGTCTA